MLDGASSLFPDLLSRAGAATRLGEGDLNLASEGLRNFDPTGTYERIRGGDIAALTGLADTLSGVGSRQEAQLAARLGLAGRPRSSAREILRSTRIGSALAPVANTIFGNLGGTTSRLGDLTFGRSRGLADLAFRRPALYSDLYNFALSPLDAEARSLAYETGALSPIAAANRDNFAGMETTRRAGIFDYPLKASEYLAGTVGNLSDAAGSVFSAIPLIGGIGGMLGGGGGGVSGMLERGGAGGLAGMWGGGGGWGGPTAWGGGMGWNPWSGGGWNPWMSGGRNPYTGTPGFNPGAYGPGF